MTEAVVVEAPVVAADAVVELSPVEQAASEAGWMPKIDWEASGKDPNEWRSAKEFQDRGEFYKTINSLKRENKQTQATLTALQRHHQYVFEKARIQAIDELKKERRVALRSDDPDRVEAIENQIEREQVAFAQEKAALVQSQQAAQNAGVPPEFEAWKQNNSWYDKDQDLHDFADATGLIFIQRNPNAKPDDVLKHIDMKMKKQLADKVEVRRAAPNPTAVVDRTIRVAKKDDIELNELETEIMKTLVQSGTMTKEQYIAEIKAANKKGR